MRVIETEIEIDAPPEEVWRVLTDFKSYPAWNPFVKKVEGEVRVGNRLNIFVQIPEGRGMKFTPRVLYYESPRELRWIGSLPVPGLFNGEHIFKLERTSAGLTRFLHGERFTGLLIPFLGSVLDKTERGYHLMNKALKMRVESGAHAAAEATK